VTPSGSNRPKECRPIWPQDHEPPWPRPQMGASHLLASASHRLATTSAWRLRGKWKVTAHDCGKHLAPPCPTSSWRSCFETVFATLAREQADGLLVNSDVFFTSRRDWLVALTARHVPLNLHFGGDEMSTEVPNASARSSSRVSQRMRVYRKRRRQGLRSVRVLLPVTDIDYFVRVDKIRGGKCAVKSMENPSARIGYQNKISASFPLDAAEGKSAPWIDIEFRKGGALVKLGRTVTPVGACEGTGRFVGTWRKTAD
jgi:hypothetical protein